MIAIDENTRASLPADLPVDVIQNSFTHKRASSPDPVLAARLAALRPGSLKVGFVGNLHHSKGLFDLLEAVKIAREMGRDIECVVVGGVTIADRGLKAWLLARAGLAQNVQAELAARVQSACLADAFHLVGHTNDIQSVYERLDVHRIPLPLRRPGPAGVRSGLLWRSVHRLR